MDQGPGRTALENTWFVCFEEPGRRTGLELWKLLCLPLWGLDWEGKKIKRRTGLLCLYFWTPALLNMSTHGGKEASSQKKNEEEEKCVCGVLDTQRVEEIMD